MLKEVKSKDELTFNTLNCKSSLLYCITFIYVYTQGHINEKTEFKYGTVSIDIGSHIASFLAFTY